MMTAPMVMLKMMIGASTFGSTRRTGTQDRHDGHEPEQSGKRHPGIDESLRQQVVRLPTNPDSPPMTVATSTATVVAAKPTSSDRRAP